MKNTFDILKDAKNAAKTLHYLSGAQKTTLLLAMADALEENEEYILSQNGVDVEAAKGTLSPTMIDRLLLTKERFLGILSSIRTLATANDPLDDPVLEEKILPNGLVLTKKRVPLGVVGIIYESRPNVTADGAALCFKSGNVCVLRGGRDAFNTSFAIIDTMRKTLASRGFDPNFINLVEDTSRESAKEMMTAVGYIDVLIPRGGAGLIQTCVENATVPCIQTGTGICHVYVDRHADIEKALNIVENAKTSRPSVCNAAEVCLVHEDIAPTFLPLLYKRLCVDRTQIVELRCDEKAYTLLQGGRYAVKASETDFDTEFLRYVLAVKVLPSLESAIEHIGLHSTKHSDCIVSENEAACEKFTFEIDSAAVYINASTRFTDGGEFGKSCEIGISTQKLHARGPMGLEELCTYKFIVKGTGQVR